MLRLILSALTLGAALVSSLPAIMAVETDGSTVAGVLELTDSEPIPEGPSRSSYEYMRDVYAFEAEAGATVDIHLASQFDGYLILFDGDGNLLAENDDAGTYATSRITATLASAGTHYAVVTSFNIGIAGEDTISVHSLGTGVSVEEALEEMTVIGIPIEGRVIEGELEEADNAPIPPHVERADAAHYRDVHITTNQANDMISIDLVSDFDGYLILIDPNAQVIATNDDYLDTRTSRIDNAYLPVDGDYTVVVTSFGSHATGTYTLTIGNPTDPTPDTPIVMNQTAEGQIEWGDSAPVPDGTPISGTGHGRDGFALQSAGNESVEIHLTCHFDAHLVLIAPNGSIIEESDSAGPPHTRHISATMIEPGEHRILVGATNEHGMGTYVLTLSPGLPVSDDRPIATASSATGELTETSRAALSDPRRGAGNYYRDGFHFMAQEGTQVTIDLTCQHFDGYLFLVDSAGDVIASNDDHRGTMASRIQHTLTQTGRYRIVVTAYHPERGGEYNLAVSQGFIATQPPPTNTRITLDAPIAFSQPILGNLARNDSAVLPDPTRGGVDYFRDGFVFNSIAGARVQIDLGCEDFDGYLYLIGPSDEIIASNDDYQSTQSSQIVASLAESGDHRIIVTTFGRNVTGGYTLSLVGLGGLPPTQAPSVMVSPDQVVSSNVYIGSNLTSSDHAALSVPLRGTSAHYRDGYTFSADAGTDLQITLQCQTFDGYLYLIGPNDQLIAENDDWQSTADAQITATVTQAGDHRVVVTSYQGRTEGDYTLEIKEADDPTM